MWILSFCYSCFCSVIYSKEIGDNSGVHFWRIPVAAKILFLPVGISTAVCQSSKLTLTSNASDIKHINFSVTIQVEMSSCPEVTFSVCLTLTQERHECPIKCFICLCKTIRKRTLILLGITNVMLFLSPEFLLSMLSLKHQKRPQKWLARYFFLYHH